MAKWFGKIGYAITEETNPGVWAEQILEKDYFGDMTRNIGMIESSGGVNDDLNLNNTVSIIADPYALEYAQFIRYVVVNGAKWKVRSIEIQHPRLLMTIGGIYNGE